MSSALIYLAFATTVILLVLLCQRDTTGLTTENSELKIRLQTMEQQVHLQDALNDTLKTEVQRLKVATGQVGNGGGGMMLNFGAMPRLVGGNQQMFHSSQAMQSVLATHQLQQLQLHSQPQQQQLHSLQLQQVARDLKMKGHLGGQGQWGDGKSGSGSRSSGS
ncbi:putative transcription factor PosF21 [Zea mays]|uniref:Putative transcription factor PosF21 n=1 Tax=Zea mays TaxID=4577 RepID=A0A1D6ET26_MAIZE|nr:putative transcription factor PosF21 [Zea mays]